MEILEKIQCPFCWQYFDIQIDTSIDSQKMTIDCEICCRPFELYIECRVGEVLSLEIQSE